MPSHCLLSDQEQVVGGGGVIGSGKGVKAEATMALAGAQGPGAIEKGGKRAAVGASGGGQRAKLEGQSHGEKQSQAAVAGGAARGSSHREAPPPPLKGSDRRRGSGVEVGEDEDSDVIIVESD